TTNISSDSTVTAGGNLSMTSKVNKHHDVSAEAAAYADGVVGTAVAVSIGDTTSSATLDGDATVSGNVTVDAKIDTSKNDSAATATVGPGAITKYLTGGALNPLGVLGKYISYRTSGTVKTTTSATDTTQFGLGAAINVSAFTNTATARIGPGSKVSSGGD